MLDTCPTTDRSRRDLDLLHELARGGRFWGLPFLNFSSRELP